MTKEDVKRYIEENGNARLVVDTVKNMYEQGAPMTIEELDRRMHPPVQPELKTPEKHAPSYGQDAMFQEITSEGHSNVKKNKAGSPVGATVSIYLCYVFSMLIYALPFALLRSGRTPVNISWEALSTTCMLISLILVAIATFAPLWAIYEKANQPGWFALIPIWNIAVLCRIVYDKPALVLLYFIPGVNAIMGLTTNYMLAKCFDKSTAFSVANALVSPLLSPVMAYDDSFYKGPAI